MLVRLAKAIHNSDGRLPGHSLVLPSEAAERSEKRNPSPMYHLRIDRPWAKNFAIGPFDPTV